MLDVLLLCIILNGFFTGYKMQKRVGDIEEFAFDVLTDGQQLHITLAISGWLTDEGKGKQQFLCQIFYCYIFQDK